MGIIVTIVHVLICLFLIIVVLLQSGKAADLAGAFGGMGSQTAFGPRGAATLLSKATTVAAGLFMLTSLTLSILATRNAGTGSSVLERAPVPTTQQQQQAPAAQPGQPGAAVPPAGQPGAAPTGQPPAGNQQPALEFTDEKGQKKVVPLDVDKLPRVDPNTGKQVPPPAQK
jgi:preprotein translocase subunit SecG